MMMPTPDDGSKDLMTPCMVGTVAVVRVGSQVET